MDINLYKQYRNTQVQMHIKILKEYVQEEDFKHAARILDILNHDRVVIKFDWEKDALYDFNIYGNIRNGKNTLSRFSTNYSPKNHIEEQLLISMKRSDASLYEIEEIDKDEKVLIINDVLGEESKPIKLIDLSLSESVKKKVLIYTRLLHLGGFSITSGLGFIFSDNHKDYILNRSRKMLKKINTGDPSTDRFIVFFNLNRSDGMPILFENVK